MACLPATNQFIQVGAWRARLRGGCRGPSSHSSYSLTTFVAVRVNIGRVSAYPMQRASWQDLPRTRLLTDVSLWSADLANLAAAIERVEPFADSYHFDVCDAHFAPTLLFFPDLLRALRPLTARPFHVHLMVERPTALIEDFVASGADLITVHA